MFLYVWSAAWPFPFKRSSPEAAGSLETNLGRGPACRRLKLEIYELFDGSEKDKHHEGHEGERSDLHRLLYGCGTDRSRPSHREMHNQHTDEDDGDDQVEIFPEG